MADIQVFQVQPTEELKVYQQRVNDTLKQMSQALAKLSGASGESTQQETQNIQTAGYNILTLSSGLGASGAFTSNNSPTNKTLSYAYGAKRGADGVWVATNKTSVIQEMADDGKLYLYSDTGLTEGQAFTPTQVGEITAGGTTSGVTLLTKSSTEVTKTTNAEVFYTYTIPGGTLAVGDILEVKCLAEAPNTTAVNLALYMEFGGSTLTFTNAGSGANSRYVLHSFVHITGAATQNLFGEQTTSQYSAGTGVVYTGRTTATGAISGALDIKVKLAASGGTRTITTYGWEVTKK